MGEFHRSPSKVWWAGEESLNWRAASASPGSQDSGFSDTENSPHNENTPNKQQSIPMDLLKSGSMRKANLSTNFVEKSTPQKSIQLNFNSAKSVPVSPQNVYYLPNTPTRRPNMQAKSEPAGRFTKNKHHQKVSRNLFRSIQMETTIESNQYAQDDNNTPQDSIGSEVTSSENNSCLSDDCDLPDCVKTLPLESAPANNHPPNLSAPAILHDDENEAVTAFNQSYPSSECDSELEGLFQEAPKHTSTPKVMTQKKDYLKLGRMHAMNLMQKYKNERVPPTTVESAEEGTALQKWMEEIKQLYEPECMTTLQCKSIAGELSEKVSQLAGLTTNRLRLLLYYNNQVEIEFDKLKNQKKHRRALAATIAAILAEFLERFQIESPIKTQCDTLQSASTDEIPTISAQITMEWNQLYPTLLNSEVKNIVSGLEDPRSELDVRARLTGLTSITLRNEHLITLFINTGAVQVITMICEKCEGSSVRGLALRALSTLCINASAIRKFENADGVQLISETIIDESRPEPERTEAIALLAQITAPWIEDNHSIKGLHKQSKKLVKYLTKMLISTKCCQNILLCTAALANLTAMDVKSIKYLLLQDTVKVLLETVKSHGFKASIYLLEQVATLIANMSSVPEARAVLTRDGAPVALMCFLQSSSMDDSVVKRLQQKSMIGLSRLCGENEAARQVVEMGGVERLVILCKEKKERFDSDAILVAALATLRKIADACGAQVVNEEDAQELIQPRLLDSFLAYSAQNESLV